MLSQIARSPLDSTGLTVSAKLDRLSEAGPAVPIHAFLNIDPRGLRFNLANGHRKGRVLTAFVQLDAKGAILTDGITEQTVSMDLTPETYDRLMQTALKLDKKLLLDANAVDLCIIALDENTGMAGSLHIPLAEYLVT